MSSFLLAAGITTTVGKGLYNPLTLSGTILVNGMVASVHSDWFLDAAFDALDISGWLPSAYQVRPFHATR